MTNSTYCIKLKRGRIVRTMGDAPCPPRLPEPDPSGAEPSWLVPATEALPEADTPRVILWPDDFAMPVFPGLDTGLARTVQTTALNASRGLILEVATARDAWYRTVATSLDPGYQITDHFWLINAIAIQQFGNPPALSPDVLRDGDPIPLPLRPIRTEVENTFGKPFPGTRVHGAMMSSYLQYHSETPFGLRPERAETAQNPSLQPIDSEIPPERQPAAGRAAINADPLKDAGYGAGWIALLDTAVDPNDPRLLDPQRVVLRGDCTAPDRCRLPLIQPGAFDPNVEPSHAQKNARNLSGHDPGDARNDGISEAELVCLDPYVNDVDRPLALVYALEAAVRELCPVVLIESQKEGESFRIVAEAADRAFDCGAVVLITAGNSETLAPQALGHRALAVGGFDVVDRDVPMIHGSGRTSDGRIKPELLAPTGVGDIGKTSGAAPFAAGAALLLRNLLSNVEQRPVAPGQVYAALLMCGQSTYPFRNEPRYEGVGRIVLPGSGWLAWGCASVRGWQTTEIPLRFEDHDGATLDAALWWPERGSQLHGRINLELEDARGNRTASIDATSVFQRATLTGQDPLALATLRIIGKTIPGDARTVYWAAFARSADD